MINFVVTGDTVSGVTSNDKVSLSPNVDKVVIMTTSQKLLSLEMILMHWPLGELN